MKKVLIITILTFISCNLFAQKYSDSTWIIGNGHVGYITMDMDEQKLTSYFKADQIKTDKKTAEGNEYSVINITADGDSRTSIELETMCMDICVISRIMVFSSRFKTIKGIGIGSTIGDLRKVYNISSVIGGEKGILVYIDEIDQTGFGIEVPKLRNVPGKIYEKNTVPDNAQIEWIYMY